MPSTWDELNDKQLLKIAKLLFSQKNGIAFDYKLLTILLGLKWYKVSLRKKILFLFRNRAFSDIKVHYGDFYKRQNLTFFIEKVRFKKNIWYGPGERLSNLTIGEYSVAQDLVLGYHKNISNSSNNYGKDYLVYLFALLYQNSVNRKPFIKEDLPRLAESFKKLRPEYLYATLLSYNGCIEYLSTLPKYSQIFPKPKEGENTSKPKSSNISELILHMSAGTFGDYEKTFNTNLYTFLDNYVHQLKKATDEKTNITQ